MEGTWRQNEKTMILRQLPVGVSVHVSASKHIFLTTGVLGRQTLSELRIPDCVSLGENSGNWD